MSGHRFTTEAVDEEVVYDSSVRTPFERSPQ